MNSADCDPNIARQSENAQAEQIAKIQHENIIRPKFSKNTVISKNN